MYSLDENFIAISAIDLKSKIHYIRLKRNCFAFIFTQCEWTFQKYLTDITVADPGFPRGGGANSKGGRQHTILPNFPKNCMKLKEFGPGGGARPSRPP